MKSNIENKFNKNGFFICALVGTPATRVKKIKNLINMMIFNLVKHLIIKILLMELKIIKLYLIQV
jgi:hypothetical protein